MTYHSTFKQRLGRREPLLGTFVKTPSAVVCEVLGSTSLDAVCLDAEHAPFDRLVIDRCVRALRATDKPSLVRVPSAAPEQIQNALDVGATGVVVPHVSSAQTARSIAQIAHFGRGGRGYAGSTRAAGYMAKPIAKHLADSAAQTTVIAQIEDVEAVDSIEEIAAVEGIDCLFVGRIDLTVALGASTPHAPEVIEAVETVCAVAARYQRPVGMFVSNVDEVARWRERGASFFLLSSDHAFLMQGAQRLVDEFNATPAD